MTEETTEQTVVDETKVAAQPASEESSARETDDLDALLSEYDNSTKPSQPTPEPQPQPAANNVAPPTDNFSDVRQFIFNQDMERTIGKVRGSLDAEYFDDALVKGWINEQAIEDPRLAQAWQDRYANPKQYQKVVDGLSQKFAKKYGRIPDKAATEDREAVAAAVRGASTKALNTKPPAFGNLTNREYSQKVKEEYGFDPGV